MEPGPWSRATSPSRMSRSTFACVASGRTRGASTAEITICESDRFSRCERAGRGSVRTSPTRSHRYCADPSGPPREAMIDVRPVTLEGGGVRLEPLTEDHHDALATAAGDGRLW